MFNHTALKRSLITCVAVAAAAFPAAAGARALLPGDLAAPPPAIPTVHADVSHAANPPATDDFRWDDAGIGAAATIVLLGAGGVAANGLRRWQPRRETLG
jgi:hypothetical protein